MILLIEDDDTTREVTATLLRYGGHDVHTAMNGRHALALLQTIVPTVIFCDLHMPQLDGWGFRRAQMSSSQLQRIPFVAVS
ncbi:MAG: response regulator, partial [Vicinamibacterales bacterium]